MGDELGSPSLARRWLARLAATLAAWLVAFVLVVALLTLFADELASLPLALRALLISGVLVSVMANLVMPVLGGDHVGLPEGRPNGPPRPHRSAESLDNVSDANA